MTLTLEERRDYEAWVKAHTIKQNLERKHYRSLTLGQKATLRGPGKHHRLGCDTLRPDWLKRFMVFARKYLNATSPGHHFQADHIIPVNAPMATGLTVPKNMQYIPRRENLRRRNKLTWEELDQIAAQQMWELQSKGLAQ